MSSSSITNNSGHFINVAVYLSYMARIHPYQPAIYFPAGSDIGGRVCYSRLTYGQLDIESNRIGRGLLKYGFTPGMRTALLVTPSPELFALTFAMLKSGIIPVMVDPGMGAANLKTCLKEAEIEGFIGIPKAHIARKLFGWGKKTITKTVTVFSKSYIWGKSLQSIIQTGSDEPFYDLESPGFCDTTKADAPAAINFTSGSTGVPKGVEYTHGIFSSQVQLIRNTYGIEPGEIDLCTFPLFALFAPALGMTSIIPDMDFTKPASVNPENIIQLVNDFGPTNMFGSPALLNTVGRYCVSRNIKFPTLRRVICAGAPINPAVLEKFTTVLTGDARVHSGYGATEAMPIASIDSQTILEKTRFGTIEGKGVCVGFPNNGIDIDVIPITGEPVYDWTDTLKLAPGKIGEITVRGPVVTQSYFRREDANRISKIYDSETDRYRHRMGDLGWIDESGRIWFCGRKNHRVQTKNGDMYTIPVEGVFNHHPDVYRTALVGLGNAGDEIPVLCIELEPDAAKKHSGNKQYLSGLVNELWQLGQKHTHTQTIYRFVMHSPFPVDVRHNSKIFREKLRVWVADHQKKIITIQSDNGRTES